MLGLKLIVLLNVAAVVVVAADPIELPREWHAWKAQHGVNYQDHHEEFKRHTVWKSNQKYIEEHNRHKDTFGYELEMNKYGDMVRTAVGMYAMCTCTY